MFMINTLFLICLVLALLYIKWYQMKMFWKKKGIPQAPVHPILGSMTFLQKINVSDWLLNIYKQYPYPYAGIWVFWRPGLVINSPDIAQKVLVKDSDIFRNRLCGTGKTDELGALNLFNANDPLWSFIRKQLTSAFTPAKLRNWQNLFRNKSADLIGRIKSDNVKGIRNNLKLLFADYTTDIIGESAFGIKCEATKNSSGPLREMTKEFEKFSIFRAIEWSSIFFFPELADLLRFTFWPKHTGVYFKKLFNMIVEERGGYNKKTDGSRDLMDVLIKMKEDAKRNDKDLNEVVLVSNALIFLQGGYDSSSVALTYATYELAYKPHYQEMLYDELIKLKDGTGIDQFEADDLAKLPYFNAVLKETLRKYPVIGWLDRVALQDYEIDENLKIPQGTAVLVNIHGMQRDPKYFPEPNEFKPNRFLPENEKDIVPYSYLPFGGGPRFCIGIRFAWYTMRFALAAIIMNFILKPLPKMPVPNDVVFVKNGILIHPSEVLSVEFVPRH